MNESLNLQGNDVQMDCHAEGGGQSESESKYILKKWVEYCKTVLKNRSNFYSTFKGKASLSCNGMLRFVKSRKVEKTGKSFCNVIQGYMIHCCLKKNNLFNINLIICRSLERYQKK